MMMIRSFFFTVAAVAASLTGLPGAEPGLSFRVNVGSKGEKAAIMIDADREQTGTYVHYSVKRITIINGDGSVRQAIDCRAVGDECQEWIGEYYESDAEVLKKNAGQGLPEGQDFLAMEDVNFDGSPDMIVRAGCGTGGCRYRMFLYHPVRKIFVFSSNFSAESELIRSIGVDRDRKLLEIFAGYQSEHSLVKFKVSGFDTLEQVYSKWMSERESGIICIETTYAEDGRPVVRKWTEKLPE